MAQRPMPSGWSHHDLACMLEGSDLAGDDGCREVCRQRVHGAPSSQQHCCMGRRHTTSTTCASTQAPAKVGAHAVKVQACDRPCRFPGLSEAAELGLPHRWSRYRLHRCHRRVRHHLHLAEHSWILPLPLLRSQHLHPDAQSSGRTSGPSCGARMQSWHRAATGSIRRTRGGGSRHTVCTPRHRWHSRQRCWAGRHPTVPSGCQPSGCISWAQHRWRCCQAGGTPATDDVRAL